MEQEDLRLKIEQIQQMQKIILESEKSVHKTEKVLILICMAVGGLVLTLIICIICYLAYLP